MPSGAAVQDSLGRVQTHSEQIKGGQTKLGPGQPLRLSEAAALNDAIAQGDLNLVVRDKIPEGYVLREDASNQLVPGENLGAKHVLQNRQTAEIYNPPGWSPTYDELAGPFLKTTRETTIDHPVHGAVTLPAGFIIECRYQRVWDQEQARERRQRD
jgi:hypothetical protein